MTSSEIGRTFYRGAAACCLLLASLLAATRPQRASSDVASISASSTTSTTTALTAPNPPGPLVQKHADGTTWQYLPHAGLWGSNWVLLDNNPATVDVVTDGSCACTYQLHSDGTIWQYIPHAGLWGSNWVLLDNNPATVQIAAGPGLFQLHRDGSIWVFGATPITGWFLLYSSPGTVAIRTVYSTCSQYCFVPLLVWLHRDGSIWTNGSVPEGACEQTITGGPMCVLDNNPATVGILADGSPAIYPTRYFLYQLHSDGTIWQYLPHAGLWGSNWVLLDNNPDAIGIAAGLGNLYQLHRDGTIWHYVTPPIRGWALLDNNPATDFITSSSGNTFIP